MNKDNFYYKKLRESGRNHSIDIGDEHLFMMPANKKYSPIPEHRILGILLGEESLWTRLSLLGDLNF
jgi:hypothetical protein